MNFTQCDNNNDHNFSASDRDMMAKHKDYSKSSKGESEDVTTVAGANRAALHRHGLYNPKGWITHGLTSLMQLPNATPTAVLRWTTPEGPMPHILHLPSRDHDRHIKIYVWIPPTGLGSFSGTQRPCLIDFHGGGFIMGGPLEQAPWCAALARAGIIAITVHYRLGPTWEFPAALLDAEDVINAVLDAECNTESGKFIRREILRLSNGQTEFDESRIGISGFSSGGNIALNMLLSIPAHLNTSKAGGSILNEEDQDSTDEGESDGDWPSPFLNAQSPLRTIPALLFFPSLDARQAPFDRKRPEGMAPQGEVSKWIGKTLLNAYLPQEFVSHLRASPGLAPIGLPGGLEEEVNVRKLAAKQHGLATDSDENALKPTNTSSSTQKRTSAAVKHATLDCMHLASRALLILPKIDTLSEQSEVWVEALDAANKLSVSPEKDGSMIGKPLLLKGKQDSMGHVRVHRIEKMTHGFTTFPDSFIDEKTRAAKKLVMDQALDYVIEMFKL
ncbi:hypothetical protein L7F22_019948 [Adiantum nelumboides]|nr:hypothetical protein [Adiantum nelumboides]